MFGPFNGLHPRLVVPTSFEECLTYGQRQLFMWQKIQELEDRVQQLEQAAEDTDDGK